MIIFNCKNSGKRKYEKIYIKEIFQIIENRIHNSNLKITINAEISYMEGKCTTKMFYKVINNGLTYGKNKC